MAASGGHWANGTFVPAAGGTSLGAQLDDVNETLRNNPYTAGLDPEQDARRKAALADKRRLENEMSARRPTISQAEVTASQRASVERRLAAVNKRLNVLGGRLAPTEAQRNMTVGARTLGVGARVPTGRIKKFDRSIAQASEYTRLAKQRDDLVAQLARIGG